MQFTNVFWKNVDAKKRYVFNQGGSWSSKTYSELQKEIIIAQKRVVNTGLMSESVPHLRMGMIRDFYNIMVSENMFDYKAWNKTEGIYTFENGSIFEFFSADNVGKVHGGRRNRLLVNELNHIPFDIFRQAAMRTKEQITSDYNPNEYFYAHKVYIENPAYAGQIDFIHSTYLDNPYIPLEVLNDMLAQAKNDPNYEKVYLRGEVGTAEGLIFPVFNLVDEMPTEYKWRVDGEDYGFTDPTTHIKTMLSHGALWFDELFYEKGLVNLPNPENPEIRSIVGLLKEHEVPKTQLIIGDSAEPKTISDIMNAGYFILPAVKGADSIRYGNKQMKQYPLNVTKRSVHLIDELRKYQNKYDKIANDYIDEPVDKWNHCIDPARYATSYMIGNNINTLTFGKR
jgi:phage terminase large subunit